TVNRALLCLTTNRGPHNSTREKYKRGRFLFRRSVLRGPRAGRLRKNGGRAERRPLGSAIPGSASLLAPRSGILPPARRESVARRPPVPAQAAPSPRAGSGAASSRRAWIRTLVRGRSSPSGGGGRRGARSRRGRSRADDAG